MVIRKEDYVRKTADYIKRNLAKGYTIEALKWSLIDQGYSRTLVNKAIELAQQQLAEAAPKLPKPEAEPKIEIEKLEKKSFWARLFRR